MRLICSLRVFILLLLINANTVKAQVKKDSLENILWNSITLDTNRVLIHEKLAYHYRFISPDTALYHATLANDLSQKLKYTYGLIYSLNHLGVYYQNRGQYNQAMSYYNEMLEFFSKDCPPRIFKAIALAINNIGMVHFEKEEFDEAEYYFQNALKIDRYLHYPKGIARELGNLGKLKIAQGNSDSALVCLRQSLDYEKSIHHTIGMLETMVDIGKVYYQQKQYQEAKMILYEASNLNKECYLKANVWIDQLLSGIYYEEGDFDSALQLARRAFQNAKVLQDKMLSVSLAQDLSEIYSRKGMYFEAYSFLDTVNILSNNLQKETADWQRADMMAGFESDKKRKEIKILQENRDKMIYYNSRLISMRNGLVLSLCFCLVLGGIIYKAYRDKRNVNKVLMTKFGEIRSKNADIQNKNREIGEINSSLIASNITLNKKEFQLKEAQRIAGLGSWEFDLQLKKFAYTEYLKSLFFTEEVGDQEMNFRSYLKRIDKNDWPAVKSALKKAFIEGEAAEVEFSITDGIDQQKYFNARAVPMMNDTGERVLVAGTVFDNSKYKKAAFKLMEAKENAEMANQSKSVFLANMSHEIRTPLNGILGFTQILLKECNVPQQKEYLKHIQNSGDNLLVLLNDILDFNKIEHGKLDIEATNFQLREMVNEAIVPYLLQAKEKGLDVKVHCTPEIPANVLGDPYRTRQLLINYLSNALKFTKTGYVMVDISLDEISVPDGNDLTIRFTVSDTGIGIPEDKQENIFKAFTQADSSTTRKYGGTGLGLAINNELAKLMGGTSGVQSPGRLSMNGNPGSDFWFTIKVKRGHYTAKAPTLNHSNDGVFENKLNILVAEDNVINQLLIRKVLESMNCEVTLVENGKLAVEALTLKSFDALLMDIQMPVMDGHQAAMVIRQSGNISIPIIGVSANVFKEDIEKSLMSGMDAHLGKPFTAKELFQVLKDKIRLRRATT